MTVDIFIPCFIDQIFPETGMNMVKILEKYGVKVNYNDNQTCCGQMAFNSGFWDEAKELGEKFINDFPNDRPVVSPSASCSGYVKNFYGKLFFNTGLHLEYKRLQKNMFEFTDFLVNVLKVEDTGATFNHTVTYHDSCASLREYKLKDEPRKLLSNVKGLKLVELKDNTVCCGFGGTFSVKHEAISSAMAEQKVQNALDTEAEYIVSTDSSCLMHQDGYITKNKHLIKTIHIIDILASGW
ncbi:MAG: (Fe-S)-binding protein [Bacteroidales bacterium]|nr:(Fe-S)-binding protein [Bacteroidales bacterium]MCF8405288.1 (Fe-S)-binding protein [Bacteroidales bacterium]